MIMKTDERIRELRELSGMTQSDLARRLGVTRSSVNAWEMGISIPTTDRVIELAHLYRTSTDYILGVSSENTIHISDYSYDEQELIFRLIQYFDKIHGVENKKPAKS